MSDFASQIEMSRWEIERERDEARSRVRDLEQEIYGHAVMFSGMKDRIAQLQADLKDARFIAHEQNDSAVAANLRNVELDDRIATLEQERDAALSDYRRWHQAFLEAKYPDVHPTRVELETKISGLEDLLRELINIEGPLPGHVMWARKVAEVLGITLETAVVTSMDHGGGPFDKDGKEGPNEPNTPWICSCSQTNSGWATTCGRCSCQRGMEPAEPYDASNDFDADPSMREKL